MDLLGYLLGALPPHERQEIDACLARDSALRRRLDALRSQLAPLALDDEVAPPPGLAERTIAASRSIAAVRANEWAATEPPLRFFDLAVVAAVLMICAFLILPAIASLRNEEMQVLCKDHLRQLSLSLAGYQAIEAGRLPAASPSGPLDNAGVFSVLLQARGLLPQARILTCPTADSAVVYVPRLAEYLAEPAESVVRAMHRREMGGSYGYSLGRNLDGRHVDPGAAGGREPIAADRPPRPAERTRFVNSPNHGGQGENVLFADGHVEFLDSPYYGRDHLFLNDQGRTGAGVGLRDACLGVSEATPYPAETP
jgi:prepilin-type processing-associated H-X9-DG protein